MIRTRKGTESGLYRLRFELEVKLRVIKRTLVKRLWDLDKRLPLDSFKNGYRFLKKMVLKQD